MIGTAAVVIVLACAAFLVAQKTAQHARRRQRERLLAPILQGLVANMGAEFEETAAGFAVNSAFLVQLKLDEYEATHGNG